MLLCYLLVFIRYEGTPTVTHKRIKTKGADNTYCSVTESSRCITNSCMGSSATVPISHFCTLVFLCLPLYVDEIEQSLDVDEPSLLPSLKCFRNHYLSFLPCVSVSWMFLAVSPEKNSPRLRHWHSKRMCKDHLTKCMCFFHCSNPLLVMVISTLNPKLHCLLACFVQGQSKMKWTWNSHACCSL